MIRLAIAIASACAVVWYAGGNLGAWEPAPETRAAIEQTAQLAREQAAKLLVPEAVPAPAASEPTVAEPEPALPAPAALVEPLEPEAAVEPAVEFAPEPEVAEDRAPRPNLAERGWDAPLDAAQAEAVRGRLDRVMELAAGVER